VSGPAPCSSSIGIWYVSPRYLTDWTGLTTAAVPAPNASFTLPSLIALTSY